MVMGGMRTNAVGAGGKASDRVRKTWYLRHAAFANWSDQITAP
jgi:hypothetical protein